ncbi:acyl-CoA thioesterase [Flavobacterium sp. Fl-318]|jgi:thioesterase-3|uniref:Acyl-CoA thioesterase n=1 Tax=Flavobacterium cupriresistens TaxID=2893885 RepID=A0ABU4R8C1_9FLAO|nr:MULTISPECIES: acyl-CoA thioesterase [unclassified Flavobacterium]MDX6188822.1 acyl-CoA thioesterase [Flavobacterium sp. Fl-318]UFH44392.1 acyl-CoA thioesterase [Flavobacterium sp. F-323]
MEKVLKTKRKIRFQDCDPFNHLNNAKYLEYFINTREDQIAEHYNLDIFKLMKTTALSWVVASNQISYMRPASTMETVVIESQLIQYTDNVLLVEMKMWNENETELKALLWIKFIHYNLQTTKVANHADNLMQLFQSVVVPVEQTVFENRYMEIVQKMKSYA